MQQTQTPWWKKISVQAFSRGGEFRRDPQLSWKVIVVLFVLGILGTLAVGYLTYYQGVRQDSLVDPVVIQKSTLRAGDVKAILETYQGKKEHFNALLSDQPAILSPGKGSASPKEEKPTTSPEVATSTALLP